MSDFVMTPYSPGDAIDETMSDINSSFQSGQTVISLAGGSYTVVAGDEGKVIENSNAFGGGVLSIYFNASLPVGFKIYVSTRFGKDDIRVYPSATGYIYVAQYKASGALGQYFESSCSFSTSGGLATFIKTGNSPEIWFSDCMQVAQGWGRS